MTQASLRFITLGISFVAACARADTVVLAGAPAFEKVRVAGFRDGRLVFRGVSGETLRKPIERIERIAVESEPTLSAAEAARAAGDLSQAIDGYRRMAAQSDDRWSGQWARWRLIDTLDRADRFEDAFGAWLEALASGTGQQPPQPRGTPETPVAQLREALQLVREAATSHKQAAVAAAARSAWLDLALVCADELPPELAGAATAAASASAAATEGAAPPLLFGGQSTPAATQPTAVTLPLDSITIRRVVTAIEAGDFGRALELLGRARPFVATCDAAAVELLVLRCEIATGDASAALDRLLGLAETGASREIQARALYYAGLAAERLERRDEAERLYRRVLAREDLAPELRAVASERLAALAKP